MKYGGAVVGGGLLAGCTGGRGQRGTSAETTTGSPETTTESPSTKTESGAYQVCMEPTGCARFDREPERWYSLTGPWADMAVALGRVDGVTAMVNAPTFYFEAVDVSIPENAVTEWSAATEKETFYELDSDVHFIDPNTLVAWTDWTESDIEEVEQNVGPFFGVRLARFQADYQADYPRYSCTTGSRRLQRSSTNGLALPPSRNSTARSCHGSNPRREASTNRARSA